MIARPQTHRGVLLVVIALLSLAGLWIARPASAQNDGALTVCATCQYTSIEEAIQAAPEGATIEVHGGNYAGPIAIDKPLTLIGIDNPVIDGGGKGTIVRISAPNVVLKGFVIQNSGINFDKEDSAVYVEGASVQILDNQMLNTLFGVNAAKAPDLLIQGNTIVGMDVEMGIRGDGIKVWYSQRTQIIDNYVERSRDLLVWYSNGTVIRDNTVRDGRYGFHFMNSDDGLAEHNRLFDNSVGIYLMYGKHFTIKDNLLQGSRGPSGHGLGIKEVDGVEVEGNIFYDNRIGVYIDNSPLSPDLYNHFTTNLIAFNDIGLGLLPSTTNNVFTQNSLVDNLEQVTVLGGGQLGENQWAVEGVGNFWSDYAGYDANGDGIGDLPFRSEQLSEHLMSSWPVLQLYRFSVAEAAVDFGARAVPLFRNEPKFIDPNPLVEPVIPVNAARPEYNTNQQTTRLWAIGLLAFAGLAMFWGWKGTRSVTNGERTASRRTHDASQPSPAREAALGNPEKLS